MSITTKRVVEYKSTWTLTWDFEADLLNLKGELCSPKVQLDGVEGMWGLAVEKDDDKATVTKFARPASVRLVFSNISSEDLEIDLWAPSKLLSNASPYLKTLLKSGFAESVPVKGKRRRGEPGQEQQQAANEDLLSSDDSDDEGDELYLKTNPSHPAPPDDVDYQEIKITAARFSTWRAVLVWINTGHINFAPLSSQEIYASEHVDDDYRTIMSTASPSLPIPVSPKSVYILAHLLELPQLRALAFQHYKLHLLKANVAAELFNKTSHLYGELRDACLDVAVENWKFVKTSKAMEDAREKAEAGDLPHFGRLMDAVAMRL